MADSLERFHQSRTVIEDFSSRTLAAISTFFGRLYYINSLRDTKKGGYRHDGLASVYSEGAVQEGLAQCHEELFARILETPLKDQELDLNNCLRAAGDTSCDLVEAWRENGHLRDLCPEGAPDYLHELFSSNMNALLAIIASAKPN